MTDLDARVRAAERDYDRAVRHPRGEGLDRVGATIHRLYEEQRRHDHELEQQTTTGAAA